MKFERILMTALIAWTTIQIAENTQMAQFILRYESDIMASTGFFNIGFQIDVEGIRTNIVQVRAYVVQMHKLRCRRYEHDVWLAHHQEPLRNNEGHQVWRPDPTRTYEEINTQHEEALQELEDRLDAILSLSVPITEEELSVALNQDGNRRGTDAEGDRHKRAILFGAVTLGYRLATTLWGLYDKWQMKKLLEETKARVDDLYIQMETTKTTVAGHAIKIAHLEEGISNMTQLLRIMGDVQDAQTILDGHMDKLQRQISRVEIVMRALLNGRVAPEILKKGEMLGVLRNIRREAQALGYELLVKNEAQALQADASYIMDDKFVYAMLHLPLAHEDDKMQIYQFVPVPVKLDLHRHLIIHPFHDVVTVGPKKEYFNTMTSAQLMACREIGSYKICDHNNVVHQANALVSVATGERDHRLCIWYIFTEDHERVMEACEVHIKRPVNDVFQITGTDFIFVTPTKVQGTLTCPGSNPPEYFSVDVMERLKVPGGCTATTKFHTVVGVLNASYTERSEEWSWPQGGVKDILQGLDLDVHRLLQEEEDPKFPIPTEAGALRAAIRERKSWSRTILISITWTFIVAILIAAGIGTWFVYKARDRLNASIRKWVGEKLLEAQDSYDLLKVRVRGIADAIKGNPGTSEGFHGQTKV
jgi:hypothetical protein